MHENKWVITVGYAKILPEDLIGLHLRISIPSPPHPVITYGSLKLSSATWHRCGLLFTPFGYVHKRPSAREQPSDRNDRLKMNTVSVRALKGAHLQLQVRNLLDRGMHELACRRFFICYITHYIVIYLSSNREGNHRV